MDNYENAYEHRTKEEFSLSASLRECREDREMLIRHIVVLQKKMKDSFNAGKTSMKFDKWYNDNIRTIVMK